MRYSLHEIDTHYVVATTIAVDRDEALEWFSEKLRLMLTFEGDPVAAEVLVKELQDRNPNWDIARAYQRRAICGGASWRQSDQASSMRPR